MLACDNIECPLNNASKDSGFPKLCNLPEAMSRAKPSEFLLEILGDAAIAMFADGLRAAGNQVAEIVNCTQRNTLGLYLLESAHDALINIQKSDTLGNPNNLDNSWEI